jgi:hypothetical protein
MEAVLKTAPGPGAQLHGTAELPPEVLEKFYHANAGRLIPGSKK